MNEVVWRKKFTSWQSSVAGGRRLVPETEPDLKNRAAAPAQRTVSENLFGPPKLFNNHLLPVMAFRGGLRLLRSAFGSQQTSTVVSSGSSSSNSSRTERSTSKRFRNLKQFVETVNKCCQSRSKIFSNIQNLTRMEFKIIISNDFKTILCWSVQKIKLPGI